MKPETKFWHEIKKNTKQISWTRLENLSAFGTPDLLGYNTNSHLFEKDQVYLYRGKRIQELVACGLKLDACRSGLDACINHLERLGA